MPNQLIRQLQVTVDDCRKLARVIDDPQTAERLLRLADELEARLDQAAKARLGSDPDEPPRKWGTDLDEQAK